MNRDEFLKRIRSAGEPWDIVVVGGGATGLGSAVDAASRGYRTLLLEQSDFGKGTSSRSTKLVHGGVRYLQQGNVSLVLEALRERGRLLENAPHVVHDLKFILPTYRWWERPFYGIGLKMYDALAGRRLFGRSRFLSRAKTIRELEGIREDGLRGGIVYHDGQFDDARLVVALARTAKELGATVMNYVRVEGILKSGGRVSGVIARDAETGETFDVAARAVVNATGVFVDTLREQDEPGVREMVRPSQGTHIVLDQSFLPSGAAMLIPRTADGRVLFAVPWYGRLLLGTTDTPVEDIRLEPRPYDAEIEYLLEYAGRYLARAPRREDILSTFAGLRPLVGTGGDGDTASISRDHTVTISPSGLVTVTGGKWTTYREMAEDTIDEAVRVSGLHPAESNTARLRLHGWMESARPDDHLNAYGSDRTEVERFIASGERLHERLPYFRGEIRWAARYEAARTVEDVLSRRLRALLLDARAAAACADVVAEDLADELGRDADWARAQVEDFRTLARQHLPEGVSL